MSHMIPELVSRIAALDPVIVNLGVLTYLAVYLGLTHVFYGAFRRNDTVGWFRADGPLDWLSSALLIVASITFVFSAVATASVQQPSFSLLFVDFLLITLLFSTLYSLLEWHRRESFHGLITRGTWWSEADCVILSLQTMTTLGYGDIRPKTRGAQLLTCVQAGLSLFFFAVLIGKWANR